MQDYFQVGVITSTHGLKGEVKVYPTTEESRRFDDLCGQKVYAGRDGSLEELTIVSVRYFKKQVILRFAEKNNIDEVSSLRQARLLISREQALPLEEGEYYVADLLGLKVVADDGRELGILKDILTTGANDVYVIGRQGQSDLMIPAIRQCVLKTDLEAGEILVHLLPGLEDL